MRFDLTDEQKQLQANLDALFRAAVDLNRLAVADAEEIAKLRAALDVKLAHMGVQAILADEAEGGLGLGLLTLVAAAETTANHAAPTSAINNALAAWLIAVSGTQQQKKRWLDPVLSGRAKAAFAIDDGDGWDTPTTAPAQTVTCRKYYVEGCADADFYIVAAAQGGFGLVLAGQNVEISTPPPLDQTRPTSTLTFTNAAFEPLDVNADVRQRLYQAQCVLLAADAYGAGARALDLSVEYAKTRVQFGRPIGANQGLKHQLANMCVDFAPSRFLAWYAAHAWDAIPEHAARAAVLAKAHTPSAAVTLARAAVETHGAIGYTWEYPLHLFLKRAMYDQAAWGSAALHRTRAAALANW